MNTVLVVAPDEALRARLVTALGDHSVFAAQSDAEALKTLRLIDIDMILIAQAESLGDPNTVIASANLRHLQHFFPADLWWNIAP